MEAADYSAISVTIYQIQVTSPQNIAMFIVNATSTSNLGQIPCFTPIYNSKQCNNLPYTLDIPKPLHIPEITLIKLFSGL
jgi:hypothetical protein